MASEINSRDQNHITVLSGVTDDANQEIRQLRVDPTTKRLLVSAVIAGTNNGKLRVTGADTVYDYLATKLVAGTNITLTVLNPGGNETLKIDAAGLTGYNLIENEGVAVTQRTTINLSNLLTAADSGGKTGLTIDTNALANDSTFIDYLIANNYFLTELTSSTDFIDYLIDNDYFVQNLAEDNDFIDYLIANSYFIDELTNNTDFIDNIVTNITNLGGGLVQSVTGLNTDNADPNNPIVKISVDGVTITGAGTPASPLVSVGSAITAGHVIYDGGVALPQRANLDFQDYFSLTDNSPTTEVDINTTELGGDTNLGDALGDNVNLINTITDNDTFQENVLNFIGLGNASGAQFLPIGQRRQTGSSTYTGFTPAGNAFKVGSRLYTTFNSTAGVLQAGNSLRIWKNDYGSYYLEKELYITRAMTTSPSTAALTSTDKVDFCTDGTYIYARFEYTTSGFDKKQDVIRFDLDGTNNTAVNIYSITTTFPDRPVWSTLGPQAICVVGTDMYLTWSTYVGSAYVSQTKKYNITHGPFALTLDTTYTTTGIGLVNARSLTYDSNTSIFYISGGTSGVYIQKATITGSTFTGGATKTYEEFEYFGTNAQADGIYWISNLEFTSTYYKIYVVQHMRETTYTGSATRTGVAYWLTSYNYPKW